MSVTFHTSYGSIKAEIFCDLVPKLSRNFFMLAASNQYDGTKFHRNIKGFMVQGGDPTGTGKGGDSMFGGKLPDEFHKDLRHDRRGVISMANNGRDTNGAQFFFTYSAQPHLNDQYSIIGQVIDGFETLDAIERVPVGKKNKPLTDIVLENITIHANPLAD